MGCIASSRNGRLLATRVHPRKKYSFKKRAILLIAFSRTDVSPQPSWFGYPPGHSQALIVDRGRPPPPYTETPMEGHETVEIHDHLNVSHNSSIAISAPLDMQEGSTMELLPDSRTSTPTETSRPVHPLAIPDYSPDIHRRQLRRSQSLPPLIPRRPLPLESNHQHVTCGHSRHSLVNIPYMDSTRLCHHCNAYQGATVLAVDAGSLRGDEGEGRESAHDNQAQIVTMIMITVIRMIMITVIRMIMIVIITVSVRLITV